MIDYILWKLRLARRSTLFDVSLKLHMTENRLEVVQEELDRLSATVVTPPATDILSIIKLYTNTTTP